MNKKFFSNSSILLVKIYKCNLIFCRKCRKTKTKAKVNDETGLNSIFGKYLLATNIISSGILLATGDFILQSMAIHKNEGIKYDYDRLGRMLLVGFLFGPLHHCFYNWLDLMVQGHCLRTTFIKIFLDMTLMSPACISLFFYSACFLENKTLKEANEEIQNKFVTVYMADWAVWPAAQYYNFQYLRPRYRVIYINFVTMLYNIFLSYIKHET